MVLDERNKALHRKAVLQEIVEHLRKFLDTDAAPAKMGITTEGGGLVVPQTIIEAMVRELEDGPITDLNDMLVSIDQNEVAENVRQESESKAKDKPKGKARRKTRAARPKSAKG
jgi:hypothetical protein